MYPRGDFLCGLGFYDLRAAKGRSGIIRSVKILIFNDSNDSNDSKGNRIRRFQNIAIDDATRVRALKVYQRHARANAMALSEGI